MSRITSEQLKARRRDFLEEAGKTFDRMLGSDGQNGPVTFAGREDRAGAMRRPGEGRDGEPPGADPAGQDRLRACRPPLQKMPADFFPSRMIG